MPKPKPIVLLTRPQAQSERFAADLQAHGYDGEIVISPLLTIKETGAGVDLGPSDDVIFTSRHAVEFVPSKDQTAWCVGAKTAEVAQKKGWRVVSADGDVDSLLQHIIAARPTGRLLHLRGEHSRGSVADRLRDAGFDAEETIVYRQLPTVLNGAAKAHLSGESLLIVPLFSPRTAAILSQSAPFGAPIWGVAMSQAVEREVKMLDLERLIVSDAPDAESMRKTVLSLVNPV